MSAGADDARNLVDAVLHRLGVRHGHDDRGADPARS